MQTQNGRRMLRAHVASEAVIHRLGLASIRHCTNNRVRLHNLFDGQGDGSVGHLGQGGEPPFTQLLSPACFVQFDDYVWVLDLKVGSSAAFTAAAWPISTLLWNTSVCTFPPSTEFSPDWSILIWSNLLLEKTALLLLKLRQVCSMCGEHLIAHLCGLLHGERPRVSEKGLYDQVPIAA